MSSRLRIGLIGTSGYAADYFALLSQDERVECAAVCGRNKSRAEVVAGTYGVPQVYTEYRDMIAHAKLDAVLVVTPDDLHYPMTMAALEAGMHVLCEKPMAMNTIQAQEMLEAAERAGVKHMIEFTWRWMPHYQYLHHLVSQGYVGRGYHHHFRFLGNRGRSKEYTWRFDPAHSIGVLGDLGSHMVDLALWLCGDATSVSANLASFSARTSPDRQTFTGANETALLGINFADGAQGMVHVSTVAHTAARGREQYISLHGEAGTLEVEWRLFGGVDQGLILRGARHDDEDFRILDVPEEFMQGVSHGDLDALFTKHLIGPRLFVDAILNDYMPAPNFHEGFRVQQVLDAAIESHTTGRRIAIDV